MERLIKILSYLDEKWSRLTIYLIIFIAISAAVILIIGLTGCSGNQSTIPITTTGTGALLKTVANTNWLVTVAIIGIGAGFFSFLNGHSFGLKAMASCFVVLSVVLMITKYAVWIAGVTAVGGVVLLVYTILVRKKAAVEITGMIERLKRSLPDDVLTSWFINDNKPCLADVHQSKTTTKIVKEAKKVIRKRNGNET
jgi:hypothetical protein